MAAPDIVLTIEDNGIGLAPGTDIANIQSLELSLVYSMVKQLDGNISLMQGKGTKFVITLPKP